MKHVHRQGCSDSRSAALIDDEVNALDALAIATVSTPIVFKDRLRLPIA